MRRRKYLIKHSLLMTRILKIFIIALFTVGLGGCVATLPDVIPYPETGWDCNTIVNHAMSYSADLDAYIKDYLDGNAEGNIPYSLFPPGFDSSEQLFNFHKFYLIKGADVTNYNKRQYAVSPAYMQDPNKPGRVIDPNACKGLYNITYCTYMMDAGIFLPFNYKIEIKGKFPRSRFFLINMSSPFQPYVYTWKGSAGAPENPIVDADIDPDPGHVNPFRVGENRMASNRNYTVNFIMKSGKTIDLDPNHALRPPYWRASNNTRYATGLVYQGPMQDPNYSGGTLQDMGVIEKQGRWRFACMWYRIYAPDKNCHPYADGGIDMNSASPKHVYYTDEATPRAFYMVKDFSTFEASVDNRRPIAYTAAEDPLLDNNVNYEKGFQYSMWFGHDKLMDIAYNGITAMTRGVIDSGIGGLPSGYTDAKKYIRDCTLGWEGRGESQPDMGSWEAHASVANHYTITTKVFKTGPDKVWVLTGKMPTYPDTRNSLSTMTGGHELRQWTMTFYCNKADPLDPNDTGQYVGLAQEGLMDDEVVIDANRRYIIVISSAENKPSNATSANGVTWINHYGNNKALSYNIRWVSVYPDWYSSQVSKVIHQDVGWESTYAACNPDWSKIGHNRHDRAMGWYLPKNHYMTRAEFEALGTSINPATVPTWMENGQQWVKPYGWTEQYSNTSGDGGTDTIDFSPNISGRYIMLDMLAEGNPTDNYYEVCELQALDTDGNNVALNKTARASDTFTYWPYPASNVVDGYDWTKYQSDNYPTAWLYMDLGSVKTIDKVIIKWGSSYWATSYKIHTATDLY